MRTRMSWLGAALWLATACADTTGAREDDDTSLAQTAVDCDDMATSPQVATPDDDDPAVDDVTRDDPPAADAPDADAPDEPPAEPPADDDDGGSAPAPDDGASGGGGAMPKIPEVTGTCPEFRTGTATIGGLSGIALQVGAKKNGTGSLVFYWHGTGSTSGESRMFAGTSEVLAQGGIVVSPSRSLRTGGDCSGTGTFSKDDMKVADLIYACAVRNHGIDPRRVYTTGCSAGGLQAGCFATLRSSYVAAAAPNSGGIVFPQTIQDRAHIPAIMTMHGSAADTVIVTFSQTSATLGNQIKNAGGFVVNCNHGGGHCAAPTALQRAAWTFMKAHPFGTKPSPYENGLPSGFPSYCKKL
jgi:predicted esterase